MSRKNVDIIIIGGSSGSVGVVQHLLDALPADFRTPIVLVLHRMKNVESKLEAVLSLRGDIREPEDKEPVRRGCVYLAPQNYHLLIESDRTFAMDYSELVHYSRPSIDVTLISASQVYRKKTLGILLSGANRDGAEGLNTIINNGGWAIAQDPGSTEYPTMPTEAIKKNRSVEVQEPGTIVHTLLSIA